MNMLCGYLVGHHWVVLTAYDVRSALDGMTSDTPTAMHMAVVFTIHGDESTNDGDLAQVRAKSRPESIVGARLIGGTNVNLNPPPGVGQGVGVTNGMRQQANHVAVNPSRNLPTNHDKMAAHSHDVHVTCRKVSVVLAVAAMAKTMSAMAARENPRKSMDSY